MIRLLTRLPLIAAFALVFLFLAAAPRAEAASVTWTKAFPGTWRYYYNNSSATPPTGYLNGLINPTVQVNYYAEILDEGTGTVLLPGSSVPVGAKLLLRFVPHKSTDIYWFGTGASQDTPYGEWRIDAAPPSAVTCEQKDYVGQGVFRLDVYIPLVGNPPAHTISSLDGLQCGALDGSGVNGAQMHCTSTRAGAVNPVFNLGDTRGIFYYRYYVGNNSRYLRVAPHFGCNGNNTGMRLNQSAGSSGILPPTPIDIPAQSIPYPLTVTGNNSNPGNPTISNPSCTIGTPISFTFAATDPGGTRIKYGIDWNNDGTADEWAPPSGFVASGVSQSVAHTWNAAGSYTFKAFAQTESGVRSGWTSRAVLCNGTGGPVALLTADPSTVQSGNSSTLEWSSANATSCSGNGFNTDGATSGTVSTGPLTTATSYSVTCINNVGSASDDASVAVTACPSGYILQGTQCVRSNQCTNLPLCSGNDLVNSCTGDTISLCDWGCAGSSCNPVPAPSGVINASPKLLHTGNTSTISWSASNVRACTITGTNGDTWTGTSSSGKTSKPIQMQTTYFLRCDGYAGSSPASIDKQVIINIIPTFNEQ